MATNQSLDIEPNQTWVIDLFRSEDAEGVTKLFTDVYGQGYPIKTFIDPERLREENQARRTISSVARTPKGDIVGHNAIFQNAPSPAVYELGAGLVHRNYRGGMGIFTQLNLHGLEMAKKFGISAFFGEPVCNHVYAQRIARSLKTMARAIEIDLLPSEAYVREKSSSGRVAAVQEFGTIIPRPHRVFLPSPYIEALRLCYEDLDDQRDFASADQSIPAGTPTTIKTQYYQHAQVARLAVWEAGPDFFLQLQALEAEHCRAGATVIQLWLKMTCPWLGEIVAMANSSGYFFGGVLLRWFDDDGLLMQKMTQRPNFEGIVLAFDRSKKLLEAIQADWIRVNRQD